MKRLFILGDSTAAVKSDNARPETGWGEKFGQYLKPDWLLENRAVNGRSTKDFLAKGELEEILSIASSGDIALVQYGHNDEKLDDPSRGARAWHEYIVNLLYIAGKLQQKGVRAIFLTSIARRKFENGLLVDTHGDWPAAMKCAAERAGVDCIDLTIPTMIGIMKEGEECSKKYFMNFSSGLYDNYPDGDEDNTHLRPEGAEWIASLVYEGLSKLEEKPEALK
ncbi:MAG: rhamnogalacturonan acetylesterase [Spirochaetes bacterium]|uniref:Rhamnogalacturonan acetylesterase n=1 Tax=Candidatus Ornithospirochaeta stercoripullorum TaxID=2840899 RepID=A0A9D9H1I9_9SPIO|nr:rhamnogalacturonan acetylesterase [Candidatus Ornithospirochaeta stercoripullorum]